MRELGWAALVAFFASGCIWQDVCVEGAVRVDGRCMFVDRVDGGPDAVVDPDAPSAPEVRIDPAMPRTLDDLTASIVTESVDPMGGTVTYEYEWVLADTARATTPTLPHTETTKHDEWTVRVTPVAGTRRGAPGTATVTILNTPPEVITAGLSTYHPIADERVRAYPDGATDADGDTPTFTFTWLRNDTPVADLTGDTIDLGISAFAADDTLTVEVRADDGDDTGPPFTLGPFTVLPAVTQWRPILPLRSVDLFASNLMSHDEGQRRVVRQEHGGHLWELPLSTGRWVRLPSTGAPPSLRQAIAVYDPSGPRLIVFGGSTNDPIAPNDSVFELSLERGREAWRSLTVGGEGPPRMNAGEARAFVDRRRNRVLAWGPVGGGDPELWELTLATGAETWRRIPTTERPTASANGAFLYLPEADVAWYVGGVVDPSASPRTVSEEAWILELEPGSEDFSPASLTLPAAMEGVGAYDAASRRGIVVSADDECEVYTFDPDGESFAALSITEPARCIAPGTASVDTATGAVIVTQLAVNDVLSLSIETARWTPLSAVGTSVPLEVRGPVFTQSLDDFHMFGVGGLGSGDELFNPTLDGRVWHYDFASSSFAVLDVTPDATHGAPQPVRHAGAIHGYVNRLAFYGGEDAFEGDGPSEAWRLSLDPGPSWQRLVWSSGSTPTARRGAVTWYGSTCGQLSMLGGEDRFGTLLDDVWTLTSCGTDGTGCTWAAQTVARPPPRSFAASSQHRGEVFAHGGLGATTALDDLWVADDCPAGAWTSITPDAPAGAPPPRFGHTMTNIDLDPSTGPRFVVFGGRAGPSSPTRLNDAWFLERDGATWTWIPINPPPGTEAPPGRAYHVAAWDRAAGQLLVLGGERRNDLWALRIRE